MHDDDVKKVPFPTGVELSLSLFVTNGDGRLHHVVFVLGDCYELSIREAVEKLLTSLDGEGMRLVTQEEFAVHAKAVVQQKQQEQAATMLQDRGTSEEAMRQFLQGYMGREGGDA